MMVSVVQKQTVGHDCCTERIWLSERKGTLFDLAVDLAQIEQ